METSLLSNFHICFSPLFSSAAMLLTAMSLFLLSRKKSNGEVLFIDGERGEGVVLVCEEANFSLYGDHVEAGCLLLKTDGRGGGGEKDGDSVVFAGRIAAGSSIIGGFVESIAYDEVDHLAEGLWDCCFGSVSKWNCVEI
ncbi:hypothetical protein KSP39_PZI006736 [Platanthera zijinensis]|uniref:Uncharacterized protein n=1 Tax=Platanthera zijinensis TaxID=2320716 RepID=A0AAP0GA97_9ASPA